MCIMSFSSLLFSSYNNNVTVNYCCFFTFTDPWHEEKTLCEVLSIVEGLISSNKAHVSPSDL